MSRSLRLVALLACAAAPLLAGCEPWHRQGVRPEDDPMNLTNSDPDALDASFEKPEELKGFFKPRGTASWSSEARSIERSLGAVD
jgi:hypothetical protein